MVPIVQLVRASDCGSECRRFESDWAPFLKTLQVFEGSFLFFTVFSSKYSIFTIFTLLKRNKTEVCDLH